MACASIENADEENKDDFYYLVQKTVGNVTRQDVVLLHGDLSARVGCDNKNREIVIGKHGVDDITDNGGRVINLCVEINRIIGGTLYTHRNVRNLTRTSPDERTKSHIDHIIINSKWRGSLHDVRVMRNADVGSDHNLSMAMMTLKHRDTKIGTSRNQRRDISKMKDIHIKEKLNIALRNRISILQDETALTIDDFNTAMMESAKESIGHTIRMDLPRRMGNSR